MTLSSRNVVVIFRRVRKREALSNSSADGHGTAFGTKGFLGDGGPPSATGASGGDARHFTSAALPLKMLAKPRGYRTFRMHGSCLLSWCCCATHPHAFEFAPLPIRWCSMFANWCRQKLVPAIHPSVSALPSPSRRPATRYLPYRSFVRSRYRRNLSVSHFRLGLFLRKVKILVGFASARNLKRRHARQLGIPLLFHRCNA
ncbi:hypothetical protein LXA43DRAFT_673904 [Ganoderma leucocontextum]|nr:hypothetical protein LXA43DRAFT_673904 [Ganoderma leucocontextum]